MDKETFTTLLTILLTFIGSSGFWAFVIKRLESRSAERRLLIALAHDKIIHLGMAYINRGYITKDEYENINDYLYKSYLELGGNGSAERIMTEVRKLPICQTPPVVKKEIQNVVDCT